MTKYSTPTKKFTTRNPYNQKRAHRIYKQPKSERKMDDLPPLEFCPRSSLQTIEGCYNRFEESHKKTKRYLKNMEKSYKSIDKSFNVIEGCYDRIEESHDAVEHILLNVEQITRRVDEILKRLDNL